MRLGFTVSLTLIALASTAEAQAVTDSLRSLDRAWAHAYATHDTVLAQKLFADDLRITGVNGRVRDKASELEDVRPAPDLVMQYFHTTDVEIRPYGSAAVITGQAEWAFTWKGKRKEVRLRYTATYVRGGSLGWQMVALHLGQAPSPPGAG